MMRSNFVRPFVLIGLITAFITACQSKPKTADQATGAEGAGQSQPVISDKEIVSDPMGSDGGRIAGLYTVNFEYDQARLTSEARGLLAKNAEWIKSHPAVTIQIEGHTDERGSIEYNLSLGERRAKAVKTYLEGLGIEGRRLNVISYGEEKPIATGDGEETWSKNRRANFVPL